jgi:transglutaminase-like putative cysteine protease
MMAIQLTIRHETVYRYSVPLRYTIQQLRLWPRAEPHQRMVSWHVTAPGHRHEFIDAFGNRSEIMTISGPHDEVRLIAGGTVVIEPLKQGRLSSDDLVSPLVFSVATPLTEGTPEVQEFAAKYLSPSAQSSKLLALAEAIRDTVAYQTGATHVTSTAAHALQLRQGVCQDHAHLFLACCRAHGIPARYVSGYIDPGNTAHAASHAWVDAWIEEQEYTGWVSIDVTHARFTDTAHCRLAVGRDYESAAPVRGVRHGGGHETMYVKVDVQPQQ